MTNKKGTKKIKACTGYSERRNTYYYTYFEVVENLPKIGDCVFENSGWREIVDKIVVAWLDCEQPCDDIYFYDCFDIVVRIEEINIYTGEWEKIDDDVMHLAVEKVIETEE